MSLEQQQDDNPNRVQLIISAQSSGAGKYVSKLASIPPEEAERRFSEALATGADEVFETMVGTPLGSVDQVTLPRVADHTAMIGLAGDLCGVLSFRCSAAAAARIAAQMLGTDEASSEECIRDALGEVCNMVAGSFKARVSEIAHQCMLSVPTVVSGKDYQLYPMAGGLRVQVCRSLAGSLVWMTLDVHR